MDALLTSEDVARLLGCSPAAVRKWRAQGRLRAVKADWSASVARTSRRWPHKACEGPCASLAPGHLRAAVERLTPHAAELT